MNLMISLNTLEAAYALMALNALKEGLKSGSLELSKLERKKRKREVVSDSLAYKSISNMAWQMEKRIQVHQSEEFVKEWIECQPLIREREGGN